MSSLSIDSMRSYLSKSIKSKKGLNQNKINGLLAEIDFRNYLAQTGFQDQISVGGWIARSRGLNIFGESTIVMFPEIIQPGKDYNVSRTLPNPSHGLHTICSTFHQIGISSYFCAPVVCHSEDAESVLWKSVQLGLPKQQPYELFPDMISGFQERTRRYNFLANHAPVDTIPEATLPEEYTKENLRISFNSKFIAEISDIDGILWGKQYTYPLEIKEKTPANDKYLGDYFGLDVGPFVKLAYYAAKQGNMNSIFVVREIDNANSRELVNWWYITFEQLASFASWVPVGGGKNMSGGGSTVVRIPKNQFTEMNASSLSKL